MLSVDTYPDYDVALKSVAMGSIESNIAKAFGVAENGVIPKSITAGLSGGISGKVMGGSFSKN